MGLTSLIAFGSLHAQVLGLFGARGIAPIALRVARGALLERPTIFVLGASDRALSLACIAGELAALSLMLGVASGPSAIVCYVLYLSFVSVGAPFLPLQWDTLLLETLVLAAILAPYRELVSRPTKLQEPPKWAHLAVLWLAARLLFASGVVKLASGDETWRSLTAMSFHYETQPLPGPLSHLAHAMPSAMHAMETLLVLVLEIFAPLLALGPPKVRRVFGAVMIALMIAITATGNFGFFNLLGAVLAISAFDDELLHRFHRRAIDVTSARPRSVRTPLAISVAVLGALHLAISLGTPVPDLLVDAVLVVDRFRLASGYGLFARMTTDRPELVLEASDDGVTWRPYELRYKPGDVSRAPPQVAPHMPRLDWMLWFAALGEPGDARWVRSLERRLLEGSPEVLDLFARVPERRPRFVRCTKWDYRFAPLAEDDVWTRNDPRGFGSALRRE